MIFKFEPPADKIFSSDPEVHPRVLTKAWNNLVAAKHPHKGIAFTNKKPFDSSQIFGENDSHQCTIRVERCTQ